MAGSAENGSTSDVKAGLPAVSDQQKMLKRHVAKLYGLGLRRAEVARALVDYLAPNNGKTTEQRIHYARQKLRKWENTIEFRDWVHEKALIKLDLDGPNIYEAIARQAKRGKVDAAKLALELTGRYNAKGESQPTQVAVVFNGIPRPPGIKAQVIAYDPQDEDVD